MRLSPSFKHLPLALVMAVFLPKISLHPRTCACGAVVVTEGAPDTTCRRLFAAGKGDAARAEQDWKYSVMNVFGRFGGGEAEVCFCVLWQGITVAQLESSVQDPVRCRHGNPSGT